MPYLSADARSPLALGVARLRAPARQAAAEPAFRETLERSNLGYAYAEGDVFLQQILADREMFKGILAKIDVKK